MEPKVQQLRWVLYKRGLSWNFAVFLRFSEVWPSCYGCREFRRVATAAVYFIMLLRLSRISPWNSTCRKFHRGPWCYSCGEFLCISTAVANFAALLRLCVEFSPWCYGYREFCRLLWLSRISSCYNSLEFRRVPAIRWNSAVLLRLSGIAPCCYGS